VSHATGQVIVDGKIARWFEYNGTADVVLPKLFKSNAELSENWRIEQTVIPCPGACTLQDCLLYTDYGGGYHWPGVVCLNCDRVVEWFTPYDAGIINGHPLKHHNWPYDGEGNMLPDGVGPDD
jgi:hypothetical protein